MKYFYERSKFSEFKSNTTYREQFCSQEIPEELDESRP